MVCACGSAAERSVAERSVAERSVAERSVAERSVAERSVPVGLCTNYAFSYTLKSNVDINGIHYEMPDVP